MLTDSMGVAFDVANTQDEKKSNENIVATLRNNWLSTFSETYCDAFSTLIPCETIF